MNDALAAENAISHTRLHVFRSHSRERLIKQTIFL